MKIKAIIFVSVFLLVQSFSGAAGAAENEKKVSEEDFEVIENLDFLDNLDLFREDIKLLEELDDIDQSESTGEGDE